MGGLLVGSSQILRDGYRVYLNGGQWTKWVVKNGY